MATSLARDIRVEIELHSREDWLGGIKEAHDMMEEVVNNDMWGWIEWLRPPTTTLIYNKIYGGMQYNLIEEITIDD